MSKQPNYIRQRGFPYDNGRKPAKAAFTSKDELLDISWVQKYSGAIDFVRYEKQDSALVAVFKSAQPGDEFKFVIGYIERPEEVDI